MILIGMTGKAGAGKDTVADYLVREHGFVKLSFAGPLKAMLAAAGMPEPADRDAKEQPIPGFDFSWRMAAQALGTEWGRKLDPDIWVKVMGLRLSNFDNNARVVLSDVRFENEARMIRALGGRVVFIRGRQADLGAQRMHVSEAGLRIDSIDALIDNSGDLSDTLEQIRAVLRGMA
jgi:ribose 1,5-bisphosphokinase PhnN